MQNQPVIRVEHVRNTLEFPLVVARKFVRAPVEKIFAAWADENIFRKWWGPNDFLCIGAHIDFRIGGNYKFGMRSSNGQEIWCTGQFLEIEPTWRFVCSNFPANSLGDIIALGEAGHGPFFLTVEFFSVGEDEHLVTVTHEGLPAAVYQKCVEGWESSLEKLKKVVEDP